MTKWISEQITKWFFKLDIHYFQSQLYVSSYFMQGCRNWGSVREACAIAPHPRFCPE